jgi:hypothetical protein
MDRLPDGLVEAIVWSRSISIELVSTEEIIDAAQQIEAGEYYLALRRWEGKTTRSLAVSKPFVSQMKAPVPMQFVKLQL